MARRMTDWEDTLIDTNTASGAQDVVSLTSSLGPTDLRGVTLIRMIVNLWCNSTQVAGAWGTQTAFVGIGIVTQEAFVAGVVPDPNNAIEEPARGWIYRTAWGVAQNGSGCQIIYDKMADIRAARKIENGQLFLALNNVVGEGTAFTLTLKGIVRCLLKLP